jgi:hypothetical protein
MNENKKFSMASSANLNPMKKRTSHHHRLSAHSARILLSLHRSINVFTSCAPVRPTYFSFRTKRIRIPNLHVAVYLCHECEEHHDFPSAPHTEDEYFNVDDSGLTGNTPLGSSFVYQDDQQGDEGENDSEAVEGGQAEEDEGALDEAGEGEQGEEGEDEEDEEDEANPPVPESVAGSEAPAEDGATISSHRSWHTLLVFQNQVAEEEPEHDSSSQGAHDHIDLKPSGNLGPDADDKVARLESRIESLESHMNELKEMLAELLAR